MGWSGEGGGRGPAQRGYMYVCFLAKSLQSCPALCDPMDYSPPSSSVHGFPRQEYRSGCKCPSPGDLSYPGIKHASLMSPEFSDRFFATSATWEALYPRLYVYI